MPAGFVMWRTHAAGAGASLEKRAAFLGGDTPCPRLGEDTAGVGRVPELGEDT